MRAFLSRALEIGALVGATLLSLWAVTALESRLPAAEPIRAAFYILVFLAPVPLSIAVTVRVARFIRLRESDTVGPLRSLVKRAFDILVSALMVVLTGPMLLATAVAVKLDSPGPLFVRERRIGLNGREFVLLKLRTTHVDNEARLETTGSEFDSLVSQYSIGPNLRVTRVGRFLRRTSIDEVPMFWNVLKGEMSVVGPRPPTPDEVLRYEPWQRRRLSVKPGITCTWRQVSGISDIEFDRWMIQLDLEYIDKWSFGVDIDIVARSTLQWIRDLHPFREMSGGRH